MTQIKRHRSKDRRARGLFWGSMTAAAITAAAGSIPAIPNLLMWLAGTLAIVLGAALAVTVARMPQSARTLWSFVGAWGLLLAFLSLTV